MLILDTLAAALGSRHIAVITLTRVETHMGDCASHMGPKRRVAPHFTVQAAYAVRARAAGACHHPSAQPDSQPANFAQHLLLLPVPHSPDPC